MSNLVCMLQSSSLNSPWTHVLESHSETALLYLNASSLVAATASSLVEMGYRLSIPGLSAGGTGTAILL
jgi:hypothetical protein